MRKTNVSLLLLLLAFLSSTTMSSLKTNVQDDEDFKSLTSARDKYDERVSVEYDDSGSSVRLRFSQSTETKRTIVYEYVVDPQTLLGQNIQNWSGGRVTLGEGGGYERTGIVTVGGSRGKQAFGGRKDLCFRIVAFEQNLATERLPTPQKACIIETEKYAEKYDACREECSGTAVDCSNEGCPPGQLCRVTEACRAKETKCVTDCMNRR